MGEVALCRKIRIIFFTSGAAVEFKKKTDNNEEQADKQLEEELRDSIRK
jgi:hypothetical protein